jgi:hypothetical protein
MDVNTVWVLSPKQEKKRKLHKKEKCFLCKKQGHLTCNCLKKKQGPNKKQTTLAQVHTTHQIEDKELDKGNSPAALLWALQSQLGKEAFIGVMDEMIEQEDF